MYKIFINEHLLAITDNENDFFNSRNYRLVDDSEKSIIAAIEMLENSDKNVPNPGLMIMTENADETFKKFRKKFTGITAGGGVVYNKEGQLLLIKRQGKWDLPKGKKDEHETIENASVREVREECGIEKISVVNFITHSYHTYYMEGRRILKTTHWYHMQAEKYDNLQPQEEENITELKWVDPATLELPLLDTYNSIRWVLETALSHK